MEAQQIKTDPDPFAAYRIAQGYRVGDLLFLSGQAAIDRHGAIVGAGDFDAQVEQCLRNISDVLEAGGIDLSKL